jgi:hypothetical protein
MRTFLLAATMTVPFAGGSGLPVAGDTRAGVVQPRGAAH